jgi:hypothetical protein
MASHSNLIDWIEQKLEQNQKPYLLIDTAQIPNSHLKLTRWKIAYISLFEQTTEQSLIEIAPLLIPLTHLPIESARMVCDWAMGLAYDAPCLCWMSSSLSVEELAEHLRKFHTVGLSDQQAMLLRWYDTRILPVWMACLSPVQAAQFTAGMQSLQYVDRFGATSILHNAEPVGGLPATPAFGQPLIQLTDQQYGMLVDASETDVLVNHLRRVITDETNALPPRLLFEFVGKYQQRAAAAGIDDLDRQTQYLLLALFTSGQGVEHVAFTELIKIAPSSLSEFFYAMQSLPDSVWNAAPPLWAPDSQCELPELHQ